MKMSLYSYRIFQAVVQQKSFSKAAQLLNLSPSAVSHAVAKLEEDFGFTLFIRNKKSAVLNENGLQVYQYIQDILNSSDMLERKVSQINGIDAGVVRLGVIDSVAVNWLRGILELFQNKFPVIEIQVKESNYKSLIEGVVSRELDIAIVSHNSVQGVKTALQFIPLYEDRLICVCQEGFVPQNRNFVSVEELPEMKIILPYEGNEVDIQTYLLEQKINLVPDCSTLTNSSLLSLVKCGFGSGIASELMLQRNDLQGIEIYPLVPFGSRTLGAISYPPKFLTPVVQQMLSCISEYIHSIP